MAANANSARVGVIAMHDRETDYTPQELVALTAPILGLTPETTGNAIIILDEREHPHGLRFAFTLRDEDNMPRKIVLLKVQALLLQTLARVSGELCDELVGET
jgi:hypothetical protein